MNKERMAWFLVNRLFWFKDSIAGGQENIDYYLDSLLKLAKSLDMADVVANIEDYLLEGDR